MSDQSPQHEPKPAPGKSAGEKRPAGPRRVAPPSGWLLLLLVLGTLLIITVPFAAQQSPIPYAFFHDQVEQGNVAWLEVQGQQAVGEFREPPLRSELEDFQSRRSAPTATSADDPTPASPSTDTEPSAESGGDGDQPTEEATPDKSTADGTGGDKADDQASESNDGKQKQAAEGEEPERLEKEFTVTLLNPFVENEVSQFWLEHGVDVRANPPTDYGGLLFLVMLIAPLLFLAWLWFFMRRTRDQMMGGGMIGGVTRSPARRYEIGEGPQTTFEDVAGLDGVKRDLEEIVDFLKDPARFQRLGARVPKGVLLMGPPGTGKTLLAKAVAGEAGVPFFSISGSEFIQLFVGVGASRVRDLFKTAKAASPAILFIDEIDAVGRQRGAGLGGGHDEREQTLNQILSEMDGFTPTTSVIVMAATNRPDVLDPALLRPGRFDRHITVDRPSLAARRELFEVHTREMPIADDVDFNRLARATVGLTGADIRNLANEAALWATRHDKKHVGMDDFEFARDKILMGAQRDDVLNEEEKRITAYHEAGHTVVAWKVPGNDRVHKVTIIPRGRALGVTQLVPDADRHNMSESDMYGMLAMVLGGRTAEKITFDEYSAGAENDLKRATELARRMVTLWGMSERIGPIAFQQSGDNPFLGREIVQEHRQYSEHTAQVIDEEIAKILHSAADRAKRCLVEHRAELVALAEGLLEREMLNEDEIEELLGPSVNGDQPKPVMSIQPPSPAVPAPTRDDQS